MESPQRAQLVRHLGITGEDVAQLARGFRREFSSGGALLENATGMADEPFVFVQLQFYELCVAELRQIEIVERGCLAVSDFINSATGAIRAIVIVTLAQIVPIRTKDTAVRAVGHRDRAKPRVVRHEERFSVMTNITRAVPGQFIVEQAVAMDVGHHYPVAICVRPIVALIDHRSRMRMAATKLAMFADATTRFSPIVPGKVFVI